MTQHFHLISPTRNLFASTTLQNSKNENPYFLHNDYIKKTKHLVFDSVYRIYYVIILVHFWGGCKFYCAKYLIT